MIVGLGQGLGSAGMAMIGQANGRRDFGQGRHIAVQLVVFSAALGIMLAPVLIGWLSHIRFGRKVDRRNVFAYLAYSALLIPFRFLRPFTMR
jgi:Na+-driven multidrug efflux pump